ncbi:hypothetical protein DL769_006504 [Monosporascus sp. CRB-8-3]|nr:hypothetical protein DL769_006504 [Monosporascus sp. CRB-8-3]
MSWTLQIGDPNGTHVSYSNSNSRPGRDAGDEGYYENHDESERHHHRRRDRDRARDRDDDEYHDSSERRSRHDGRGHRHGDSVREHHDSRRRRRRRSRNQDDGGDDGRGRSRSHHHRSGSPEYSSHSAPDQYNQYSDSSRRHRHRAVVHYDDGSTYDHHHYAYPSDTGTHHHYHSAPTQCAEHHTGYIHSPSFVPHQAGLTMHYDGQYGHGNFTIADAVIQQNPALIQASFPFFPLAGPETGAPGSASGRGKVLGEVGEDKAEKPS